MGKRSLRVSLKVGAAVAALALVGAACSSNKSSDSGSSGGSGGTLASAPGFDLSSKTITVGAITPQTGIAAIIGSPLTNGNQVYFDALNAQGGIAGKYKVKLLVGDSQYSADTAQQVYAGMKDKVAMIAQSLGTDITNSLLPRLKADQILASPASLDAEWVRTAQLTPIGGPYQIQAINALDYWMRHGGSKSQTVCVMRQDDTYGEAGLNGVKYAQEQMGFKLGVVTTFRSTDTSFTGQEQQIQDGNCNVVYLVALPDTALVILGDAAAKNIDVRWIGQSPTWVSLLATGSSASYLANHFWLASEGPQWGDTSVPGMKQMMDDIAKFKPDQKPDIYFAFGYAQAWGVAQVLEKAIANKDMSRAGIEKAAQEKFTLTFGDLVGDYDYGPVNDRVPPDTSTVFGVDPSIEGGLKALQQNFASPAAKSYQFPKAP